MNIKLIVMDMDGTLLNKDGIITQGNVDALIMAQQKGIKLALASGRTYRSLTPFGTQLQMEKYGGKFICANGVMVMDVKSRELEIIKQITPRDFKYVYDLVKPMGLEICALYDTAFLDYIPAELLEKKKQYCKQHNIDPSVGYSAGPFSLVFDQKLNKYEVRYLKEDENIVEDCNKVVLAHEPEVLEKYYPEIKAALDGKLTIARTRERWYEISPYDVDKGKAIMVLQEELGISKDETLIFGDGENDLSMFACSTYPIAIGNGMDLVKEKAYFITVDNNSNPIQYALEKLGII